MKYSQEQLELLSKTKEKLFKQGLSIEITPRDSFKVTTNQGTIFFADIAELFQFSNKLKA
jgi:hypothetical protein